MFSDDYSENYLNNPQLVLPLCIKGGSKKERAEMYSKTTLEIEYNYSILVVAEAYVLSL